MRGQAVIRRVPHNSWDNVPTQFSREPAGVVTSASVLTVDRRSKGSLKSALGDSRLKLLIVLIITAYVLLASGVALTKQPWCDEACFANPAVDLITRGSMGFTARDPMGNGILVGYPFPRIQTRTYFIMPLEPVLQAAWFKMFGVSVFTMRSLQIVLGLCLLAAWGYLVWKVSGQPYLAVLAMALIAVDRSVVLAAADGRPDITSAAFGVTGLAIYMALRERHFKLAVLAANSLIAMALFSHPVGAISAFGLLYLSLRFDRRELSWRHLPFAAAPFLLGFGLWGWYISLDPEAFLVQFTGNASTGRFGGLSAPLASIWREIAVRYGERSYLPPYATGWRRIAILVPLIYGGGVLLCNTLPLLRNKKAAQCFGGLAILYFSVFSIFEGTKADFYLIHISPILCCCGAIALHSFWVHGLKVKYVALGALIFVGVLNVSWHLRGIRNDSYSKTYRAVTAFVRQHAAPGALVMGSAELGFELGYYGNLVDDATLGYYSGKKPDFVVMDEKCSAENLRGIGVKAPHVFSHVTKVLTVDCEEVFAAGSTRVYARRGLVDHPTGSSMHDQASGIRTAAQQNGR